MGKLNFVRVSNFAILSYSQNSRKFDTRKICVLQYCHSRRVYFLYSCRLFCHLEVHTILHNPVVLMVMTSDSDRGGRSLPPKDLSRNTALKYFVNV